MDALEPDELHQPCFVAQAADQAFGAAFTQGFQAAQDTSKLHRFAFVVYIADLVEFGAVYIPKGEMVEQVATREDAQLGFERFSALRADTFEVFYVGIEAGQNQSL